MDEIEEWWKVGSVESLPDGGRIHTCIEGRYITVFRHGDTLGAIDSTC